MKVFGAPLSTNGDGFVFHDRTGGSPGDLRAPDGGLAELGGGLPSPNI